MGRKIEISLSTAEYHFAKEMADEFGQGVTVEAWVKELVMDKIKRHTKK
jgi:hypothetical protein